MRRVWYRCFCRGEGGVLCVYTPDGIRFWLVGRASVVASDWLTAPVGLRDYLQSFGMKKLAHQRGLCMRGGTDERL
ncbi:MAG: hypothetical protein ACPIOQ_61865 [Promethearchaeia archaeon]